MKRRTTLGLLAAATVCMAAPAQAAFPDKPVKILIGFPAGGTLGAEFVAKSPADGYTLLMANTGTMVINPAVYTRLPYQTLKDFVPIARTAQQPLALVVNPSVPAQTVQDLAAPTRPSSAARPSRPIWRHSCRCGPRR